MKVSSVKNSIADGLRFKSKQSKNIVAGMVCNNLTNNTVQNQVSFKGNAEIAKKFFFQFRKLSEYMKNPSEMTNALIAMIGTGIIAPFAIMCSPKKKCNQAQDEKKAREKKFFQAIRQPISAFLAFGFQVPTTVGISRLFDYLAFKKQIGLFQDKALLGKFIPIKKYLVRQAKKALKENASSELKKEWAEELDLARNTEKLKAEFRKKLIDEYKKAELTISDEKLDKLVNNKRKFNNFVAEKISKQKYDNLLAQKVSELASKNFDIKDIDLVTPKYQNLAKETFSDEFKALKKNAKLNFFDKFISVMGFSNKKLNALSKAESELAKEKGLIIMKEDIASGKIPNYFKDSVSRLRKFIKDKNAKAQKIYGNKVFWLSLVANLFMVAASCTALNWLHPKFAQFVDNIRGKNKPQNTKQDAKVEVKAA